MIVPGPELSLVEHSEASPSREPDQPTLKAIKHAKHQAELTPHAQIIHANERHLNDVKERLEKAESALEDVNEELKKLYPEYAALQAQVNHSKLLAGVSTVGMAVGSLLLGIAGSLSTNWYLGFTATGGTLVVGGAVIQTCLQISSDFLRRKQATQLPHGVR